MQDRHTNYELYFKELAKGVSDIVIPYIESVKKIQKDCIVLEVGCGLGGNLHPFLEKGCKAIGIDIYEKSIERAREFFNDSENSENLSLLNNDFYKMDPNSIPKANLVLIRDVLEHMVSVEVFFERLKEFLARDAIIFVAFPPWRMPFGGHQQGCKNSVLAKMPYYHLLPRRVFEFILKTFGEDKDYIDSLYNEVRRTRLSICKYKKILRKSGFKIEKETYYLINPSYKIKFGLNPKVLPGIFRIPFICDFYTTAHYSLISKL
jgi:SAM-dependent methyltransferase